MACKLFSIIQFSKPPFIIKGYAKVYIQYLPVLVIFMTWQESTYCPPKI